MMKYILLLLGSGLLAGTAHAQLGVRIGGSLCRFIEAGTVRQDHGFTYATAQSGSHLGYHLGSYYVQQLSAHLSLVPEVQLNREQVRVAAFNYALPDAHYDSDYTVRATYLQVPVLVRWRRGPVYVEAGPPASVLLAGHEAGTVGTSSQSWGARTQALARDVTGRSLISVPAWA